MTGQVSTRTVTDKRFERHNNTGVDRDVPSATLLEQLMSDTVRHHPHIISNFPTLAKYGQDDQMTMSDAMRWINTIKHTASIGDLEQDRTAEQLLHDMDDEEVLNELTTRGLVDIAERLRYLYEVTEEDEEDIKLDSLRGFAIFMIKNPSMHLPQITITDDGLIQTVWKSHGRGTLVMDFQESGDVEFTLLYGRWDQESKRRKLSGELHPDQAIIHVGHFIYRIMGS